FLLIDTGGNPIRNKTFGKQSSGSNDFITSVLPIESGYLLGGSTNSLSGSQFEFNGYLIKTDQNLFQPVTAIP
ncbi:MAG: hypothetical protein H0V65_08290, partial [Chitinophagales bacterium]|nr:hypothetical protein [Chitinophagales bacterium]